MAFEIKDGVLKNYVPEGNVRKIVIPEGVTIIGDRVFYGCSSLNSIEIPEGVTEIGESAFSGTSIKNIIIPSSVNSIKAFALGSVKLESVCILGNPSFEKITSLFDEDSFTKRKKPYEGIILFPNVHPSKIQIQIREQAVLGYCKTALSGAVYSEETKAMYDDYLKRNRKKIANSETGQKDIILYMLNENLFCEDEIDTFIEKAARTSDTEYAAKLLEYSNKNFKNDFDSLIQKEERKLKEEIKKQEVKNKKIEYEASPISKKISMNKELSEKSKVELLEETVFLGTIEDIKSVFKVYAPFEFTARALGYACRYRDSKLVEAMLDCGATFEYEYTPELQKKYTVAYKSKSNVELTDYSLMLILGYKGPKDVDINGASKYQKNPSSSEERVETALMLYDYSKNKDIAYDVENVMHSAAIKGDLSIAKAIEKKDISLSEYHINLLTNGLSKGYDYMDKVAMDDYIDSICNGNPQNLIEVFEFLKRHIPSSDKLRINQKMIETNTFYGFNKFRPNALWNPDVLKYIVENFNTDDIAILIFAEEIIITDDVELMKILVDSKSIDINRYFKKLQTMANSRKAKEISKYLKSI